MIRNGGHRAHFELYNQFKVKLGVFLTGHTVAMVTCYVRMLRHVLISLLLYQMIKNGSINLSKYTCIKW